MATGTISEERTAVLTVDRHNVEGDVIDTVELDVSIFGVTPNVPLMHQVVTAQLAARRSGTHSTKTRSEVRGGGAKPYRQKGTGRARQGTTRAPQFAGGGVAFGPKPRSYAQRTPRKMVRLALSSALSDRLMEGKLRLIDGWRFEVPKTKDALAALRALKLDGRIVIVLASDDTVAERSFGNLPDVYLVEAAQLTAYEVLANDWIVFTSATIPGGFTVVEGSAEAATAAREAAAEIAAEEAEAEAAIEAEAAAVAAEVAAEAEVADAASAAARDAASASGGETSAEGEDSAADVSSAAGVDHGDSARDDEDESEEADASAATSASEADSPSDNIAAEAADGEAEADADDAEGEVSRPGASSAAASEDEETKKTKTTKTTRRKAND
jgi:large subunit ribosomal protein L4